MSKLLERIATMLKLGEVDEQSADVLPRGNRRWCEQAELFGNGSAQNVKTSVQDFDFSATEIVRVPRPPVLLAKKTQHGMTVTVGTTVEKQSARNAAPISRLFSVNHAVQGDRGFGYRVVRAARAGVSADYDLWKGPTRQVTFLLG